MEAEKGPERKHWSAGNHPPYHLVQRKHVEHAFYVVYSHPGVRPRRHPIARTYSLKQFGGPIMFFEKDDPEVTENQLSCTAKQEVLRLDISMHDPLVM